ncbi:D-2-hydroxyacid dehydrogenase [Natronomonas sp. F2-12]|jgi:D-2-hydroxyacid dehydrogenase (NADP+)|uniref:D-2-hydroxyacid dehydrogenase n=1 Tax=Natronomonas aquatica TaxID=2841590 RepID=A0A9R1CQT7_9EURY|nr:D-2-hydroxyacid dehydrogenase [Natronomonas aquatica]MCQ4332004.1 D-2-hydroxyacid dehydrogenase [Natronomonas aquatica]
MLSTIGIHESVGAVFRPEALRDALEDIDPDVRIVSTGDLGGCDALVTLAYDNAFLEADLEWIHSIQAGVDRFPFDALESTGITLTNSTGIHGDAVGETVAGYMLSFARGLHHYRDNEADHEWDRQDWDVPFTLGEESVCVVGLGTLGRGVAARADALGMDVVGVKRTPIPVDHVGTVYPSGELKTTVAEARFVVVTVPLTDRTEGLIGTAELSAMRSDAVLINVARGRVLDQTALVDALETGTIGGAALDVFETEPLPADSPLWGMENVIVTPHAAAATGAYYRRIATLVRENVRRRDDGEGLANRVV